MSNDTDDAINEFKKHFTVIEDERVFLELVKAYKHIGYGRMQQIISNAWYAQVEREHSGLGESVHVVKTCLAFLSEKDKKWFFAVLQTEKEQGMDY